MGNKSQIGGVLSIIAGALGVIGGLIMFSIAPLVKIAIENDPGYYDYTPDMLSFLTGFFIFLGVVAVILGALGITGGRSVKKKSFGMALMGAIVSIFTVFPVGIAAVILVSMARNEFNKPGQNSPPTTYVQPPTQPPTTPVPPPAAS